MRSRENDVFEPFLGRYTTPSPISNKVMLRETVKCILFAFVCLAMLALTSMYVLPAYATQKILHLFTGKPIEQVQQPFAFASLTFICLVQIGTLMYDVYMYERIDIVWTIVALVMVLLADEPGRMGFRYLLLIDTMRLVATNWFGCK